MNLDTDVRSAFRFGAHTITRSDLLLTLGKCKISPANSDERPNNLTGGENESPRGTFETCPSGSINSVTDRSCDSMWSHPKEGNGRKPRKKQQGRKEGGKGITPASNDRRRRGKGDEEARTDLVAPAALNPLKEWVRVARRDGSQGSQGRLLSNVPPKSSTRDHGDLLVSDHRLTTNPT